MLEWINFILIIKNLDTFAPNYVFFLLNTPKIAELITQIRFKN